MVPQPDSEVLFGASAGRTSLRRRWSPASGHRNHSSVDRAWTHRPARRRDTATSPAGSAGSTRRRASPGRPWRAVCWPSPARSARPFVEQTARDGRLRPSSPGRGRGRPSPAPAGRRGACARRSTNRSRKSASRSIVHTTRVARPPPRSRDPTERLPLLARLRPAFLLGTGRVERGAQDAQRHAVGIDRQGRLQIQAAGHGAGLIRADDSVASVRLRRVKFRRVPSWMHSTVIARIRRSVRSRWGARMFSGALGGLVDSR